MLITGTNTARLPNGNNSRTSANDKLQLSSLS